MSTIALLPSTPLYKAASLNPVQCKFNFATKYKVEATTHQSVSLTDLSRCENHLFSRIEHVNALAYSNCLAAEDKVAECVSLLNQIIRNCGTTQCCFSACKQVHGRLVKVGALKVDAFIGNKLVVAYSKSLELLNDACKLFDEISEKRIPAYAALINAFCRSDKWVELLSIFQMMVTDGLLPDRYLIPTILKSCSVMRAERVGRMIHGYVVRRGLEEDVFVGNALIDMYANCGALKLSKIVFNSMKTKDVVSWTALIGAYMAHGLSDEAMNTFCSMESDGVKADLISWNALVSGFAMNGEIELALTTLEEMQRKGLRPQVNTWNGIISGCIQDECYEDALDAFVKMFRTSVSPNIITIVSTLSACASLKDLNSGKAIHGYAIKLGLHDHDHVVGSLINMYWKCGRIDDADDIFVRKKHRNTFICNEMVAAYVYEENVGSALRLFESMKECGPKPDQVTYNTVLSAYFKDGRTKEIYQLMNEMSEMDLRPNDVTFNILISGFQQSSLSHEALRCFQAMQTRNGDTFLSRILKHPIQPNPVNITSALAACADLTSRRHGMELHAYIARKGIDSNIFVASALIDMYAKCSDIKSAKEMFQGTKNKNTVTWNTMIAAYINRRQEHEAFTLFDRMLKEGVEPSSVTYIMLIPVCGEIGALRLGREMYGYLLKSRFDECNSYLAYPFIDFSAKCEPEYDHKLQFQTQYRSNFMIKYIYDTSFVSIAKHLSEPL